MSSDNSISQPGNDLILLLNGIVDRLRSSSISVNVVDEAQTMAMEFNDTKDLYVNTMIASVRKSIYEIVMRNWIDKLKDKCNKKLQEDLHNKRPYEKGKTFEPKIRMKFSNIDDLDLDDFVNLTLEDVDSREVAIRRLKKHARTLADSIVYIVDQIKRFENDVIEYVDECSKRMCKNIENYLYEEHYDYALKCKLAKGKSVEKNFKCKYDGQILCIPYCKSQSTFIENVIKAMYGDK